MLWVAFELLESIHLWSPFTVLGSVMDVGTAGMCVGFHACVLHLHGNWGESRTANLTCKCHTSFCLLDISQYSSCFCFKLSLSKLQVLYPLPRLAFPAMPSLSQRWLEPGNWESFHWKGLPVSQGPHLLLWSLILLLLPLKPSRRPPFHSKTIAALISHLDY